MAAFNFPNSPSTNDLHTENGVTFKWNGTIWLRVGNSYSDISTLNVSGIGTFGGHLYISEYLIHSGDTNTWFRFPSNDNITLGTSGAERVRIDANGFVAIGHDSPSSFSSGANNLVVRDGSGAGGITIVTPNNAEGAIFFADGTGGSGQGRVRYNHSDDSMHFSTNATERLRIDSSGNIGAGTASPSSFSATDLVISKSASAGITISVGNAGTTNTASIFFAEGSGGTGDKERGAIKYKHGDDYLAFHTNASERLRIGSAGQFGIGGANWGSSGQVLTSGGASGAVSWSTVSGTTINNNAANRIITGEGGTTLNGEANLTYDGSQITSTVSSHDKGLKIVSTGDHGHFIEMKSNRTGADNILGIIGGTWDSNQVAQIRFMTGTDTTNKDEGCIGFVQRGPGGDWRRRFMVNETGKVHITGNNLTANSTEQGLLHVNQCSANEGYVTDIMDEFTAGTAFNSTSDGRATIRVEWAKGYSGGDTTQAICGLLIDGLSAGSGPSIGVCSWARAQVGNGGGINFFSRQESVYGRDYGVYGFRKRCPSSGGGEFLRGDIESNLLGINYGMKLELKDRTGTDNYAQGIWIDEQNNGATVHCMKFTRSGTEKGSIKITDSATSFNTSSDYRLKENNVAISDGITRLKQLKPYRFNWKGETAIVDGFFAHEAQTVVPESVTGTKDEVKNVYPETTTAENPTPDPIGTEPEYQQMDHSKLVPLLTAALQEAITEIETLKTKVAALESS